jgi:hypothetical protein
MKPEASVECGALVPPSLVLRAVIGLRLNVPGFKTVQPATRNISLRAKGAVAFVSLW